MFIRIIIFKINFLSIAYPQVTNNTCCKVIECLEPSFNLIGSLTEQIACPTDISVFATVQI